MFHSKGPKRLGVTVYNVITLRRFGVRDLYTPDLHG